MAESENTPKYGEFCWLEVPVSSPTRAADFYSAVLGWTTPSPDKGTPSPLTGDNSVFIFSKGQLHGAFLAVPESCHAKVHDEDSITKSGVLATFAVESIEETLKLVEQKGGKQHVPKTEIGGGMGYFARFIDSEGNLQGIWAQN